jgi:hypothetical protein
MSFRSVIVHKFDFTYRMAKAGLIQDDGKFLVRDIELSCGAELTGDIQSKVESLIRTSREVLTHQGMNPGGIIYLFKSGSDKIAFNPSLAFPFAPSFPNPNPILSQNLRAVKIYVIETMCSKAFQAREGRLTSVQSEQLA